MRQLAMLIRYLGLLAGLFLVTTTVADIAGLIPHSDAMPSLGARVASSLPPFLFGAVLLLPHRWFPAGPRLYVLLCTYQLLAGVAGYRAAQTFFLVRGGELEPVALLVGLLAVAIPLSNAAVLWRRRSIARQSIGPKPIPGSA
ncbi:hypothetical protein AB4Y64_14455 [Lysobacter sp. TAF61]|uniref:hypothetical protein n=1 Tax=Lysobacter sp. TAF61 TaxID=3233072 RepID=UPI003F9822B4